MERQDMNEKVNYRYGVRNVHLALQTAPGVYGTPWEENNIETITRAERSQGSTNFYSNDGNAQKANGAKAAETFPAEFSEMSDTYKQRILGRKRDAGTGGLLTSESDEGATFAFGYEVQGTQKKLRKWLYGCDSSDPVAGAHQTNGENVTESRDTVNITVNGDVFDGETSYEIECHEGDPGFDTFFDAVPVPDPVEQV